MAEGKPGRLSLLTPETSTAIATRIAGGIPQKHAALAAGISERAVVQWIRLGKRDAKAGIESEYAAFYASVQAAKSQWVQSIVLEIRAIGMGGRKSVETVIRYDGKGNVLEKQTRERVSSPDWRALFTLIERRFPAEFGPDRKEMADLRKLVAELLERLDAAGARP